MALTVSSVRVRHTGVWMRGVPLESLYQHSKSSSGSMARVKMSPLLDPLAKGTGPKLKGSGDSSPPIPAARPRELLPMLSDSGDLTRKFYSVPEGASDRDLDTLMSTVKSRAATAHVRFTGTAIECCVGACAAAPTQPLLPLR